MQSFSKIRFSLVFNRTGNLNRYGEGLIQIRAYQNRRNRYFTTGVYVEPKFWSERYQKISTKHPNYFTYHQRITEQMTQMETFEVKMINRHGGWPLDRIDEYRQLVQDQQIKSFTDFFRKELEATKLKPGSLKMYRLTLNKFQEFRELVYFEELTYKLILDFDRWLRKKELGDNSIFKHHARLKRFVRSAIRQDQLSVDADPYKKFQPQRGQEPERPFLTAHELTSIEALEFNEPEVHLRRIRDLFLMSCYTGLRYGDISRITVGNLRQTEKGMVLHLIAEKTAKRLELPLYYLFRSPDQDKSKPEQLLSHYLEEMKPLLGHTGVERIKLFDFTNQYVNRSLKELATLAGISKKVTCHVARRTFATQLAPRVKAPILQRLLQHSRMDMTSIYIQLSNAAIEEELERIVWHERRK